MSILHTDHRVPQVHCIASTLASHGSTAATTWGGGITAPRLAVQLWVVYS
jgi:hypothetical protein